MTENLIQFIRTTFGIEKNIILRKIIATVLLGDEWKKNLVFFQMIVLKKN